MNLMAFKWGGCVWRCEMDLEGEGHPMFVTNAGQSKDDCLIPETHDHDSDTCKCSFQSESVCDSWKKRCASTIKPFSYCSI